MVFETALELLPGRPGRQTAAVAKV